MISVVHKIALMIRHRQTSSIIVIRVVTLIITLSPLSNIFSFILISDLLVKYLTYHFVLYDSPLCSFTICTLNTIHVLYNIPLNSFISQHVSISPVNCEEYMHHVIKTSQTFIVTIKLLKLN